MFSSIPLCGWDAAAPIVRDEAAQLREEGRDPEWIADLLRGVDLDGADPVALARLWHDLQQAPPADGFPFVEPDGLAEIQAARARGPAVPAYAGDDDDLEERLHGAWLGRCCGCALGKPVEPFMVPHPESGLSSRDRIKTYLQAISPAEYPLSDYFPASSPAAARTGALTCPASQRENIAFMESDDDLRYTVLGQKILLEKGAAFTSGDVMQAWLRELPYRLVCTAETQAYRNCALRYQAHMVPASGPEPDWHWVAVHQNPYREWIGAQIRADSWGYAAPGNPALAAEFAWRDARISHVKNGLYGAMFVAAAIAAAFVLDDALAIVEAGLAEIPAASRLHRDLRETVETCRRHRFDPAAFEDVFGEIERRLGHYHPVHTNNNAAVVVAALLLAGDDFGKAITLAVMGGWDTDCNGATVGSIFGARRGARAIPEKWSGPLHGTLNAEIIGYHPVPIRECARRSLGIARKVASGAAG